MAIKVDEFTVDGYKVTVHDDVMPPSVVDKWLKAMPTINFRPTAFELNPLFAGGTDIRFPHFAVWPVDAVNRLEIFEWDSWIYPLAQEWDTRTTRQHFHRCFINKFVQGDYIFWHPDMKELPEGGFYNVGILFLNPAPNADPSDNGFLLRPRTHEGVTRDHLTLANSDSLPGDIQVDHKFNRLIQMDARIYHAGNPPSDDFERLTLYVGYSNITKKINVRQEAQLIAEDKVPGTTYQLKD